MITTPIVSWLFTLLFVGVAGYFARCAIAARARPVELTEHLSHTAMCVVMAAMVWPWWATWPRAIQLAVFVAAAGFFLLMTVLQVAGVAAPGRHGTLGLWYRPVHAVMMAAMVWMIAVMTTPGHGHHGGLSTAAFRTGLVLTALVLAAGLIELVRFLRATAEEPTEHHPLAESGGVAAMLLGMAVMSVGMLAA